MTSSILVLLTSSLKHAIKVYFSKRNIIAYIIPKVKKCETKNIPICQCSFKLLTTVCFVGGVTSCSRSLLHKTIARLRLYKMNLQSFKLATTRNSKLVYSIMPWKQFYLVQTFSHRNETLGKALENKNKIKIT